MMEISRIPMANENIFSDIFLFFRKQVWKCFRVFSFALVVLWHTWPFIPIGANSKIGKVSSCSRWDHAIWCLCLNSITFFDWKEKSLNKRSTRLNDYNVLDVSLAKGAFRFHLLKRLKILNFFIHQSCTSCHGVVIIVANVSSGMKFCHRSKENL